jgi:hypothetical protein
LVFSIAEAVPQSKDQQKCITKINKSASKVADAQGKDNSKCVKFAGKGKLDRLGATNAQDCLTTDFKGKIEKKKDKTVDSETRFCTEDGVPDFGVPAGSAIATVANAAAVDQQVGLIADIFGTDLNGALIDCDTDKDGCKCQDKVVKNATKLVSTKLKEFIKCKKFALKEGKSPFTSGAASAADLEACVDDAGTAGSIAADTKSKILRKADKLAKDAFKKCEDASSGPVDIATAFPGACAGADASGGETLATNDFAQCIDERAECRVCLMLNDIDGLDVDCDSFDDGLANGSCPPVPSIGDHKCTLDAGSSLSLHSALPLPPLAASGAIDFSCGAVDGGTGKAPCDCSVQAPGFGPLSIAGLFWACVKPAVSGTCPTGEIDCDGGNVLGLDMNGARNIGACTSNADCAATCAASCAPDAVFTAQCEGFCTEGTEMACTTDAQCGGAGEGSCNGPDGVGLGNICDCTCLDDATGGASSAGDLKCQLAFNLTVESIPGNGMACDGADVTINVGDTCAPLSTQSATGILTNGNDAGMEFPPGGFADTGLPFNCTDLATSDTSGAKLTGAAMFYASTIGDINTQLTVLCE